MRRGWSHRHSLFLSSTGQRRQLNIGEAGPSNAWHTDRQSGTPPRGPFMCLMRQTTEKEARQESPLSAWGCSYGEGLAKEAFSSPATRHSKKDSDGAITPAAEAVRVSAHVAPPGSLQAKQLCWLHIQLSMGQNCHGQKISCLFVPRVTSILPSSLYTCRLRPARLLCQGVLQARILEPVGQDWLPYLLEHYTFCCPSCQPPWGPGAARTPATQSAAWPPHLTLRGQTQVLQGSLRSRPQGTAHMQRWE